MWLLCSAAMTSLLHVANGVGLKELTQESSNRGLSSSDPVHLLSNSKQNTRVEGSQVEVLYQPVLRGAVRPTPFWFLGQVPFTLVFTKTDKRKKKVPAAAVNIKAFCDRLLEVGYPALPHPLTISSPSLGWRVGLG